MLENFIHWRGSQPRSIHSLHSAKYLYHASVSLQEALMVRDLVNGSKTLLSMQPNKRIIVTS